MERLLMEGEYPFAAIDFPGKENKLTWFVVDMV
jgi:hypothetical protein